MQSMVRFVIERCRETKVSGISVTVASLVSRMTVQSEFPLHLKTQYEFKTGSRGTARMCETKHTKTTASTLSCRLQGTFCRCAKVTGGKGWTDFWTLRSFDQTSLWDLSARTAKTNSLLSADEWLRPCGTDGEHEVD